MAVTQQQRLEAVYYKLERIEREFYETKQILRHIQREESTKRGDMGAADKGKQTACTLADPMGPTGTGDREGLYEGQLDYVLTDRKSYQKKEESECDT